MTARSLPRALFALALMLCLAGADAPSTPPAAPEDANQLSLQVSALRTLYTLNLSAAQLQQFKTLAAGATDPQPRKPAKVTAKLTDALHAAKAAILAGQDDAVSDAEDALDDAWDTETYDIADSVAPTDAARAGAPAALKVLKAEQVVTYISQISSDVLDPVDTLMDAADEAPGEAEDAFATLRDQTAGDIATAVAGVDKAKADALRQQLADWLTTVHQMKPADEATQHADLEAQAKKLIGDIDSLAVIRNELCRNLAELLANPQFPDMIDAELQALAARPASLPAQ